MQEGYGIQLSVNSVKLLNKIGFSSLQEEDKFTPEKIDFYSSNIAKICELNISDFNTVPSGFNFNLILTNKFS